MAYHDDLLQQALDLVNKNPTNATQADLRRGISAAYYSLFHLLISETVVQWGHQGTRNSLSRMFEHRVMASASDRISNSKLFPFTGEDPSVVHQLKRVAEAFGQLRSRRHIADYDNSRIWTQNQAFEEVATAVEAFSAWHSIKSEKIAQDYLVSLLIKPRN